MTWQHTPYTYFLILTSCFGVWLAIYANRQRDTPDGKYFAWLMLALAEWTLTAAFSLATVETPIKILWAKIQYLGIAIAPPLWFSFVINYSHKEYWLTRFNRRLLWYPALCIVAMAWTNDWHNLLWSEIVPNPRAVSSLFIKVTPLTYEHGPFYWFVVAYDYILMLSAALLLLYTVLRAPRLYLRQAIVLVIATVTIFSSNLAYVVGWNPVPGVDFTNISFMLGGIVIVWGIFRLQFLDVVPVARAKLIENMSDGVLVLDTKQRIVDINSRARQFIHSDQEIVGQQAEAVLMQMPGLQTQLRDDKSVQVEVVLDIQESIYWLEVHTTPLYDDRRSQFTGWLIVFHDITVRKQAESALRQAKAAAEEANQAKSSFLANMSHELRTPLNGVMGFAQILLQRDDLNRAQRQSVELIYKSGQHLLTLINDVLDLARVESGKLLLYPAPVNLHVFLENICGIIRAVAQEKSLRFVCEHSDNLPHAVIADETRLRQVLLNLLGNATKFTFSGEVIFRVKIIGDESYPTPKKSNISIIFEVEDTGPGIVPEKITDIFSPFEQGTTSRRVEGAGLGLSISQRLVRLMGGQIEVESVIGQGSRFFFTLTLPLLHTWDAVHAPQAWRAITGYTGPRRRILVVDDNHENRQVLQYMLEPLGFEVICAESGNQGIAEAQSQRPDMILMDLVMPGIGGVETVTQLQHDDELKAIPVVAISSSAFKADRAASLEAGCVAFLPKPIVAEDLLVLLDSLLDLDWVYSESQRQVAMPLENPSLGAPPDPLVLERLRELALYGNMGGLITEVEKMVADGVLPVSFAHQLSELAEQYDDEGVLALLDYEK